MKSNKARQDSPHEEQSLSHLNFLEKEEQFRNASSTEEVNEQPQRTPAEQIQKETEGSSRSEQDLERKSDNAPENLKQSPRRRTPQRGHDIL